MKRIISLLFLSSVLFLPKLEAGIMNRNVDTDAGIAASKIDGGTFGSKTNAAYTFPGDVGFSGTTPVLTVGDGGAEDTGINWNGNDTDFYMQLDDSADKLLIGTGTTVGSGARITISSDTRDIVIGDGSDNDTWIEYDGNVANFHIGIDDSVDDLSIGVGSVLGTDTRISIASNTDSTAIVIGDGAGEDNQIRFDGNVLDYHLGIDDSADKLVIGTGTALGTNPRITLNSADQGIILGDATGTDLPLIFDGNAQDFHIGLDDSVDDFVIGVGSVPGTTQALAIDENANITTTGDLALGASSIFGFGTTTVQSVSYATQTITVSGPYTLIGSSGAITLTGTPTIATPTVTTDGSVFTMFRSTAAVTITFQDNNTLADSNVELGSYTVVNMSSGALAGFLWDGTDWRLAFVTRP